MLQISTAIISNKIAHEISVHFALMQQDGIATSYIQGVKACNTWAMRTKSLQLLGACMCAEKLLKLRAKI